MARLTMEGRYGDVYRYIKNYIDENSYPPSIREICKDLNISSTATVYYYITKMEKQGLLKKGKGKNRSLGVVSKANKNMIEVPLVGQVQAGYPVLAEQNIEDIYSIPRELFRGDELFMLRVRGRSMVEAGIFENDKLVVKRQNTADNGDIVVALVENEATVKRFFKTKDHYILHPENEEMEDIVVYDGLTSLGLVVGLIRSM